jgi:hypothetical protein
MSLPEKETRDRWRRTRTDGVPLPGGALWFGGIGAKNRMREHALLSEASGPKDLLTASELPDRFRGHIQLSPEDIMVAEAYRRPRSTRAEVQVTDPASGHRGFVSFPSWPEAVKGLEGIAFNSRHFFEIIKHGQPCRPYADLEYSLKDGREPIPGLSCDAEIIGVVSELVLKIFRKEYEANISEDSLKWLSSTTLEKLSLHLVISTRPPQLVFRSNHFTDPQGAYNLACRLVDLDPRLAQIVDLGVYTKDREMRMQGATKFGKSSHLVKVDPSGCAVASDESKCWDPDPDYVIGWLDRDISVLEVPLQFSYVHSKRNREPREKTRKRPRCCDDSKGFVTCRMLDLLRGGIHPSAFHEPCHGVEDPEDPHIGVRFNFTDRLSEKCYTGATHKGNNNLRCWVDPESMEVYAKCYSHRCSKRPPHHLGALWVDSDSFSGDEISVKLEYLDRVPDVHKRGKHGSDLSRFNGVVDGWVHRGAFQALCIRSGMGTGKTTFLASVVGELPADRTGSPWPLPYTRSSPSSAS